LGSKINAVKLTIIIRYVIFGVGGKQEGVLWAAAARHGLDTDFFDREASIDVFARNRKPARAEMQLRI